VAPATGPRDHETVSLCVVSMHQGNCFTSRRL